MATLKDSITTVRSSFENALTHADTDDALEAIRIEYLGRNGKLADLMVTLKELSVEEKRIYGPQLNELKLETQSAFEQRQKELELLSVEKKLSRLHDFDVTATRHEALQGSLHIYTHLIEQIEDIFISMGFAAADGPEVETEHHNFTALNIPENHPARDMQDTFWLHVPKMLMRTHTSPVQIRSMEKQTPPLALFAPGRVYRNEETDASHDFMFMQAECLLVDKNISVAHLMATAQTFLQHLFGKKDIAIRVRPGYFPFVEPGLEIDMSCPFCTQGCSICKKTRWIELMGSGLIHPNVLKACNIDPEIYSGFALGTGLERIAMIKYGIDDIRVFHSTKLSALSQF